MNGSEHTPGPGTSRLRLAVALVVSFGAIGTGTWVLGSGPDSEVTDSTPVVAEVGAPGQAALPPLAVAPPPDAGN